MTATVALLALQTLLTTVVPALDARGAWKGFVEDPTRRRYEQVIRSVDACAAPACVGDVLPDAAALGRLLKLVDLGQPLAVDAAMHVFPLLGGADRAAVALALGEYADAQPTRFLRSAKAHGLTGTQLAALVQAQPNEVAADEAARERAVEKRIDALSRVGEPEVAAERSVALDALRAQPQARREGRRGPPGPR